MILEDPRVAGEEPPLLTQVRPDLQEVKLRTDVGEIDRDSQPVIVVPPCHGQQTQDLILAKPKLLVVLQNPRKYHRPGR